MSHNEYLNRIAFDLAEIKLLSKAKKLLQLRIDVIDEKIDKLTALNKKGRDIRVFFAKSQCIKCNMIASIVRDSTCYHCII